MESRRTKLPTAIIFIFAYAFIMGISITALYVVSTSDSNIDYAQLAHHQINRALTIQFDQFVKAYHKSYLTQQEKDMRFMIFTQNYILIKEHNTQKHSFQLALNFMADWTEEEYQQRLLLSPQSTGINYSPDEEQHITLDDVNIDYSNLVGRVKDQGTCGSCWAFAASGALEYLYAVNNDNKVLEFSEQQIVDCCRTALTQGCNGGEAVDAFGCSSTKGVVLEKGYPYLAIDDICKFKSIAFTSTGQGHLLPSDNDALLTRLGIQAIDIGVNVAKFYWRIYSSGVLCFLVYMG